MLTRICVAVSGLVIHSVPEHWPQPINDLISMFQPQLASGQVREAVTIQDLIELMVIIQTPQVRPLTLLLELLTVIPEEFSTLLLSSQVGQCSLQTRIAVILALVISINNNHFFSAASSCSEQLLWLPWLGNLCPNAFKSQWYRNDKQYDWHR